MKKSLILTLAFTILIFGRCTQSKVKNVNVPDLELNENSDTVKIGDSFEIFIKTQNASDIEKTIFYLCNYDSTLIDGIWNYSIKEVTDSLLIIDGKGHYKRSAEFIGLHKTRGLVKFQYRNGKELFRSFFFTYYVIE